MPFPRKNILLVLFAAVCLFACSGCVKRRLVIRSFPEGALVTIDNQTIGHTPCSTPYTYAGTRDVKLELDGYETVRVQENVHDPWYLRPPFGFIVENFWPQEVDVERELDFNLQPLATVNQNQLIDRASQMRSDVSRGMIARPVHQGRSGWTRVSDANNDVTNRNNASFQIPLRPRVSDQ